MKEIRSKSRFKEKPRNAVARTHPPRAPKTLPGFRYHDAAIHKSPEKVDFSGGERELENMVIPALQGRRGERIMCEQLQRLHYSVPRGRFPCLCCAERA